MKRIATQFLLGISGALLFVIGAALLFTPHQFYASNGTTLGDAPNLLSEIRAPGGLLLACAIVILLGTFRSSFTRQSLLLSAMVYGSYGIARLISMAIDGMPSTSLVAATIIELVLGILCAASLTRIETTSKTTEHATA